MNIQKYFATLFLLAACLCGASGQSIIFNLSNNSSGGEPFDEVNQWGAQAFTTPDYAHTLTAVTVGLDNFFAGSSQVQIEIYDNSVGNLPGSSVDNLGLLTFAGDANRTLNSSSGFVLRPNTQYWVVLKFVAGDYNWTTTSDQNQGGTGAIEGYQRFSLNGAAGPWLGATGQDYLVQVVGSPHRVLNTNDAGSGSLREVMSLVRSGSTIDFDPSLNGATIPLTSDTEFRVQNKDVTIDVTHFTDGLTLDGRDSTRIFNLQSGNVVLRGLTMIRGNPVSNPGSANGPVGGAIFTNVANLTLDRCTITDCQSESGGGIHALGDTTLINCTIADNIGLNGPGGIETFAFNFTIIHCTIVNNQGGRADRPGGYYNARSILRLVNSVIAGNRSAHSQPELNNITARKGVNFIGVPGTTSGLGVEGVDFLSGDPMLWPVRSFGGLNETAFPRGDSPIIDRGGMLSTPVTVDQRGYPRSFPPDIGAVEVVSTVWVDEVADENGTAGPGDTSLREAIRDVPAGGRIRFSPTLSTKTLPVSTQLMMDKDVVIDARGFTPGIILEGAGTEGVLAVPVGRASVAMDSFGITGGVTSGNGGGISFSGKMLSLNAMSVYGNRAELGGGIYITDTVLNAENCTLSGNRATNVGGGLYLASATANIKHFTVTDNSSENRGGGVRAFTNGRLNYENCIFAGNSGPEPDLAISLGGFFTRAGVNLIGDIIGNGFTTGQPNPFGDYVGVVDPLLSKLGYYGGPTFTHVPQRTSLAVNRPLVTSDLAVDQRGAPRDGDPEIGAVDTGSGIPEPYVNALRIFPLFDTIAVSAYLIPGENYLFEADSEPEFPSPQVITGPFSGDVGSPVEIQFGLDNVNGDTFFRARRVP